MGKYQARICGDVIAARAGGLPDDRPGLHDIADDRSAPQAIFTDPQVLSVGRTESQARAGGFPVRTVEYDIAAVLGAQLEADGYTGRAKAVIEEDRRTLIGFTMVGPATASEFWLRLMETYGL